MPPVPDTSLPDALRAELPGVLAWAIRGCLAWQRVGLAPPPVVRDATAEYFAEQDAVANWVAERCRIEPRASLPARRAYTDWKGWAAARGEEPGTEKWFSAALERHFAKKKTETGRVFLDVRLLPSDTGVW